jgi:hypothetical protein
MCALVYVASSVCVFLLLYFVVVLCDYSVENRASVDGVAVVSCLFFY